MSQRRPTDRRVPAHAVASVKRFTASTHSMHQHGQPWQLPGLLRRAGAPAPWARRPGGASWTGGLLYSARAMRLFWLSTRLATPASAST